MKNLCIFIFSLLIASNIYSQADSLKNSFFLSGGLVIDLEEVRGLSGEDLGSRLTFGYLRQINDFVQIGPYTGYMFFKRNSFFPSGIIVKTTLYKKKARLNFHTSLGHAFADKEGESGYNWGGVTIETGLEVSAPVAVQNRLHLDFGIDYLMQQQKYTTFLFNVIDTEVLHLLDLRLGLSYNF